MHAQAAQPSRTFAQVLAETVASPPLPPPPPGNAFSVTFWNYDDVYVIDLATMNVLAQRGPNCGTVSVKPGCIVLRGSHAAGFVDARRA